MIKNCVVCGKEFKVKPSKANSIKCCSKECSNKIRAKNLCSKRFGKLIVLKRVENQGHNPCWLCRCDCGNFKIVQSSMLTTNRTTSCGCEWKERLRKNKTTHNETHTRLYQIWRNMKARCFNTKNVSYEYYGARGIIVCEEWTKSYKSFRNWALDNNYSDILTIDRIDVNGNYEPSNCRWITNLEQQHNKSNNQFLTYKDKTYCISEWSKITGIKNITIRARIKRGWSIEKTLTTPVKH